MKYAKAKSLAKKIEAVAKGQGFDTDGKSLKDIASFLSTKDIVLMDEAGEEISLDEIVEVLDRVVVTLESAEDAEVVEDTPAEVETNELDEEKEKPEMKARPKKLATSERVSVQSVATKNYTNRAKHGFGRGKSVLFSSGEVAEKVGAAMRLQIAGQKAYSQREKDLNIVGKTQTNANAAGGFLYNDEFYPELIYLRSQFGLARKISTVRNMSRETLLEPIMDGYLSVFKPGQGNAITPSTANFAQVQLVAETYGVLNKISNELLNDSAINIADEIVNNAFDEMARIEDFQFFGGTGGAGNPSLGKTGLQAHFAGISLAQADGVQVASGNSWADITRANIDQLMGRLRARFHANASFVCSRQFYFDVLVSLMSTSEGASQREIEGELQYTFRGKPVYFEESLAMPITSASGHIPLFFGNFAQGSRIGAVNDSLEVASSDQSDFANNVTTYRVLERRDFANAFGIGGTSATGNGGDTGPIVALATS
jgi:HK97 family phage major capsid protein